MSDTEEPCACHVCTTFEPQAWRKSLCRNCFHSLEEHSEDLLAAEAEAFAKEKAGLADVKAKESASESGVADCSKHKDVNAKKAEGEKDQKDKAKFTAGKEEDKPRWSKDVGIGKAGVKGGSTVAMMSGKSKATGVTSAVVAPSTASAASSASKSPPKSTSASSAAVAPSTTTAPTVTPATSSAAPSATSTSTSSPSANAQKTVSLTKNFASKFESKSSGTSKDKSPSKSSDIRITGASSVSAITGKLSGELKHETKATTPPRDSTKSSSLKSDPAAASKKDDLPTTEAASTGSKAAPLSSKANGSKLKDDSKVSEDKDKTDKKSSLLANKLDDKDSKASPFSRTKAAPFGKDMLKSKRDSDLADSKPKDISLNKNKSPSLKSPAAPTSDKDKVNPLSKVAAGKLVDDKAKNNGEDAGPKNNGKSRGVETVGSAAQRQETKVSSPVSRLTKEAEQTESANINKNGQAAKSAGKTSDIKTGERASGNEFTKTANDVRDKTVNSKKDASSRFSSTKTEGEKSSAFGERGKDKGADEGGSAHRKVDTSPSPGKQTPSPSTSPSKSSPSKSSPPRSADPKSSPASKAAADTKGKDLKADLGKYGKASTGPLGKFKEQEKDSTKSTGQDGSGANSSDNRAGGAQTENENGETKKLTEELKEKAEALSTLTKQLSIMEDKMKALEKDKEAARKETALTVKEDLEKLLKELRDQLSKMEVQCGRLEKDNQLLLDKLHGQEMTVKRDQSVRGKTSDNVVLEEDLEAAEQELEDVKDENKELQRQIMEMKNEMDEMYDHFRENEHDEFREIQKELDMTAKNCRILQFKLRKAERRNDQIEEDRLHYEEKLRKLQDQFDSQDAKSHIRVLEEELRIAKEVSVRLHDELDIVEDKRNKVLEENRHLTELLEHTDKRQFRMEMEIDKLRDIVSDLRQQLKEAKGSNNNKDSSSPDRKPPLGTIGKQGSKEYDVSQLMRDLCDSMERENDLKDQLKFTEEEAKMMRRRVADIDEENETLRLQLQRMSEKASKHKKKEKATQRELEEEKRHADAIKAALLNAQEDGSGMLPSDVILVVGSEGSDIISGDEPIPVSQRKDSTDEDLMNVMQMRVQLEMLEQELLTSHKKLDDIDLENENLQAEVKFLQERLAEQEANSAVSIPEPSTPNAYYEDKLKELAQDADELRWKLIEKDRELERLSVVQSRHIREHGHKKDDQLKKSKSLDTEADLVMSDRRRQLEHLQMEVIRLKRKLEESEERVVELESENEELKNRTPIVSVRADDAPLENIELKEKVRRLEEDGRVQSETIKSLTESLHRLTRDTRTYTTIATSPTVPGTLNIPGIPFVGPGTHTARAAVDSANPHEDTKTRDLLAQLHVLQNENLELRRLMAEGGAAGKGAVPVVTTGSEPGDRAGKPLPVNCRPPESPEQGDVGSTGSSACDSVQVSGEGRSSTLIRPKELRPQQQQQQLASASRSQGHREMEKGKESGKADDAGGGQEEECDEEEEEEEEEQSSDEAEEEEEAKEAAAFRSRLDSDEEPRQRSILLDYPELKSKVTTSGDESRVELMEKVLDMDEEISVLLNVIRENEALNDRLRSKVKYLKIQLRDVREESRRTELDLLQELDMLHDKNSVMSNLLDIINERAEAAEEELERRVQEDTTHSPARSASNVSQVSALSDTSMGSDEVFLNAHANKEGVITRDWEVRACVLEYTEFREGKLKVRIESLERLLAEERQKVSMAEKKLMLAGIDTTAPSVSDDVKLRMREKELLQEELLKSQRHLHIATDQIQGLKERIDILEEEHQRLKVDYGKLYDEIDKPLDDRETQTAHTDNSPSSPESPFVAKRISVVEAPTFNELQRLAQETGQANEQLASVQAELAKYKEKAKELEYKVEEINDIWRSKSAASDKEKEQLEKQIQQKTKESILLEENITNLKLELCAKVKTIAENEVALRENAQIISRLAESFKDEEGETKRHEQDRQTLLNQLSQRDGIIRNLNETIRSRDERLKEKDEILFTLNKSIEEHKREMQSLGEKLHRAFTQVGEKDAVISVLRGQISSSSVLSRDAPATCQTDAEKESFRLKEALNNLQVELDRAVGDKKIMEGTLEKSRKALDEAMLMWDRERHALQKAANILEEKVRMYEVYNTMNKDETIETLKAEAQAYFSEKEALVCELSTLKLKHESSERIHKEQTAKLQAELTDKLRLLKMEVDSSSHMATEMERLRRQAEMAYRLQQEQRIIKAEHLAMKVRYETRIDRMSKEQNKMLLTIEKIHKERELDKQIIQAIQKNLSSVKDKYTEELLRSEEDKASLQRQLKEIEESRGHLEELQKHIRDLREKTSDQDRLRAELINKFATDRASWEIERANLNSQLNQLEEQLSCTSRQQERSKDIQVNMGMAWEKERREQRRILAEAHTLALDLQEQLRSREETSSHERKELIRQMESERLNFAKMQRDTEKKMVELESSVRMASTFHKRMKDMQDKLDRDNEFWQKEKTDLLRLLAESRHVQARDVKVVEDVLSSLIRLRELGMMLQVQGRGEGWAEEPPDKTQGIDQ
ncbi:unnamed protein product, partial [Lymnaea stagnalis]